MAEHERPIVTVDVVVMTLIERELRVLVTERERDPFRGALALPGGYVRTNEDAGPEQAAQRVLRDKAGARGLHLEQLRTFAGPDRDPRGYSVSIAHLALVPASRLPASARTMRADGLTGLAFDHDLIVEAGVDRLRRKSVYSTAPAALIEPPFTLPDLLGAYEAVLGTRIDPASFRRKLTALAAVEPVDGRRGGGRAMGRSAQLFRLPDSEVRTFDRTFAGPEL